jgi:predicted Holliday junction resolvase-like endonuclease
MELLIISLTLLIIALLMAWFYDRKTIRELKEDNVMLQEEFFKGFKKMNLRKKKRGMRENYVDSKKTRK